MNRADRCAADLIQAVQSCKPELLGQTIQRIEDEAEWEWMESYTDPKRGGGSEVARKINYIDSTFGPMGLTALHVAAKGYATHTQDYGDIFNEMIRMLVEAGADPCLAFGQRREMRPIAGIQVPVLTNPGRTIAEECKGRLAPALLDAYADLPSDTPDLPKDSRPSFCERKSLEKLAA